MLDLFVLSPGQMSRIEPYFPRSHDLPRVDDLCVISGIGCVLKNGLQRKMHPRDMGRT